LTHSEALIREAQIKAMPRSKKEEIISVSGIQTPFRSRALRLAVAFGHFPILY
jgi:predicted GIY-YIG superfamily endonuclease